MIGLLLTVARIFSPAVLRSRLAFTEALRLSAADGAAASMHAIASFIVECG